MDLLLNATLLVLFCLFHSLLAREFIKPHVEKIINRDYYRLIYVIFSLVTLSLVLYFWQPVYGTLWHAEGVLFWVLNAMSFVCILGGIYSIYTINYLDFFGVHRIFPSIRNLPGKHQALSTKGPYAYCRHPMYFFFGLAGFSKPVMSYGDFEFLIIAAIYIAIAIPFEEGNLRTELGEDYDLYRDHVPAIIPRLTPWRGQT